MLEFGIGALIFGLTGIGICIAELREPESEFRRKQSLTGARFCLLVSIVGAATLMFVTAR